MKEEIEKQKEELKKFIFAVRYKHGDIEIIDFDYHEKGREMLKIWYSQSIKKILEAQIKQEKEEMLVPIIGANDKEIYSRLCGYNDAKQETIDRLENLLQNNI